MTSHLLPILYGLFAWWFATGLVLAIVALPRRSGPAVAAGAAGATAIGLAILVATRDEAGMGGAYAAFTAALVIWGAQETAFLKGWITGPFRAECPPGLGLAARAGFATRAVIHHELALAAAGLAIAGATLGGGNLVGLWTFGLLFALRLSAKLNVFLGVPNITEGFLPRETAYLTTFFRRRPMNALFPVSVTVCTVGAAFLAADAWTSPSEAEAVGATLLAVLVALGLVEHWFLVLPLPVEQLWMRPRAPELDPAEDAAALPASRPPDRRAPTPSPEHAWRTS